MWNPAGGVKYHWRARQYRNTLWRPFQTELTKWIYAWLDRDPSNRPILLLGPSAGYNLPSDLKELTPFAVEPDLLARWLLKKKFPRVKFFEFDLFRNPATLKDLSQYRVLFCNLLGQSRLFFDSDQDHKTFLIQIKESLREIHWASFHDLATWSSNPSAKSSRSSAIVPTEQEILGRIKFHRPQSIADLTKLISPYATTLFDHDIWEFADSLDYSLWNLTPLETHLIAWTERQ